MIRKYPVIQQNRQNVILFHETIPLKQEFVNVDFFCLNILPGAASIFPPEFQC
jgi:hypothetical protein